MWIKKEKVVCVGNSRLYFVFEGNLCRALMSRMSKKFVRKKSFKIVPSTIEKIGLFNDFFMNLK